MKILQNQTHPAPGPRVSDPQEVARLAIIGVPLISYPVICLRCFTSPPARREQGISLIECLVYIAVLGVVLNIALLGFNRCWDNCRHLRRNADDIARALHAGEQWRADIRTATGPIQSAAAPGTEQLIIPHPSGNITYSFAQGELHRQAAATAPATLLLDRVKASHMQSDPRTRVAAWRWELELASAQKKAAVTPLFTFESVSPQPLVP